VQSGIDRKTAHQYAVQQSYKYLANSSSLSLPSSTSLADAYTYPYVIPVVPVNVTYNASTNETTAVIPQGSAYISNGM
jgi:hypothetical protein